jgi:hypothetical protein
MQTSQNNTLTNKTKFVELQKLNLFGYVCFMRQAIKKTNKFLYYFQKEITPNNYIYIVCKYIDIEFCLLHGITLSKTEINKLID